MHARNIVLGLFAAALSLVIVAALIAEQTHHSRRGALREHLSRARARVESALNDRLQMVNALAAYAEAHTDFTEEEFQEFAAALEGDHEGVRSLQLAPEAIVTYLTHPERNESARGLDILADPERRDLTLRAIERGEYIIAGPMTLHQGGRALIGRRPVYRGSTGNARGDFWGFSSVLLDVDVLLAEAGLVNPHDGFEYALRGVDGRGAEGAVFLGEEEAFGWRAPVVDVAIPGGSWQLTATPPADWGVAPKGVRFFWWGGVILSLAVGWLLYNLLQRPESLREVVAAATGALQESEQRVQRIAANLPGAVYRRRLDRSGRVSYPYMSEGFAELVELDGEEVTSRSQQGEDLLAISLAESSARVWHEATRKSAEELSPYDLELRYELASGVTKWVRSLATPRRWSGGDVHWDGIALDITDQKLTEERLLHSQKMEAVGQLTGGLAHDFNNILAAVMSNLEVALHEAADSTVVTEQVTRALRAADRAASLTQSMLAFSRRQALRPCVCNVNQLVGAMLDLLETTLGDTVTLRTRLSDGLRNVAIDPSQFESAILNLAINARDAMPGGGEFGIETYNVVIEEGDSSIDPVLLPGHYVGVVVTDTGVGMSPEAVEHAFDPFFTTKNTGQGSGLGLSMAYGFVAQSEGHVLLESVEGRGTTVRIYLPVSNEALPESQGETAGPESESSGAGETVLLVEDDAPVRRGVVRLLELLGYRVRSAENAREALQQLEAGGPVDVLLTDVVMPGGMSGHELGAEVRRLYPETKIVLMSGHDDTDAAGTLDGALVLAKPFRTRALSRTLRAALEETRPSTG